MWIFRRHRHLNLEILSEYLDGRLGTAAQSRVSRQVDSCEPCRNELDSLRSTVNLLQALPELTPPRRFTLAAPPAPRPLIVRQPLPLRAPGWAYAGAASLAGLALAILVSADTLGLLTPTGQADISVLSSQRSAPRSPIAAPPEAGRSIEMATSQPQIASSELYDAGQPEPAPAPEEDPNQALRTADSPPESAEAESSMAQLDTEEQPGLTALAAGSVPGPDDATGLQDPEIGGTGFSENSADTSSDSSPNPSEKAADLSLAGPPESGPGSEAVLTLGQYRGTPIIWRVLEGIATVLFLALLSILVIKRQMSRRTGG